MKQATMMELKGLNWHLFRKECIITTEEMFPPTHQISRTRSRISKLHLPPWLLHYIIMEPPNNEELHHIKPILIFVSEALQNSSNLEWNSSSAMGYIQTPSGICFPS